MCDRIFQYLKACEGNTLRLSPIGGGKDELEITGCPFSTDSLSQLLTESSMPEIRLMYYKLDECHCRSLTAKHREGLEVLALSNCGLTEAGERLLLDGIRHNRGPSSLVSCNINNRLLADALRGNKSVKRLEHKADSDSNLHVLLLALGENPGLVELVLSGNQIKDESWSIMCQSLANHPALETLGLCSTASHDDTSISLGFEQHMSNVRKTHRTKSLVEMMKVNTVIKYIQLYDRDHDTRIWEDEIQPRLKINKHRPRIAAVQMAGTSLRAPLLVEELRAVDSNLNLVYSFLRGNMDLFAGHFCVLPERPRKRWRCSEL